MHIYTVWVYACNDNCFLLLVRIQPPITPFFLKKNWLLAANNSSVNGKSTYSYVCGDTYSNCTYMYAEWSCASQPRIVQQLQPGINVPRCPRDAA